MTQFLQAERRPPDRFRGIDSRDVHEAGALGFMPRMFVLATLPHSRLKVSRFVRVNGRYSLRLEARRSIGLPYGVYPRLILAYLTTQAVRTKSREIGLGRTPNDLARKLGLSPISGPRGTAGRLHDQLHRLQSMRLRWQTSVGLAPLSSGSAFVTSIGPAWFESLRQLLARQASWQPHLVLANDFFTEITRSAVPVDLRAIRRLQRSPLAIDLYVWLTYRMSYLRKPTEVPWESLEAQFGADYARPRDFRRRVSKLLEAVLCAYPTVRISLTDTGLRLYPSPPHVQARKHVRCIARRFAAGGPRHSL